MADPPAPTDPTELARLLREQPPAEVPPRTYAAPLPGLVAYAVLGAQIIRPGE